MEKAGILLGGMAVSSGVGAVALVTSNLILWGAITATIGSVLAFMGFSLIVVALLTRKQDQEAASRQETAVLRPAEA